MLLRYHDSHKEINSRSYDTVLSSESTLYLYFPQSLSLRIVHQNKKKLTITSRIEVCNADCSLSMIYTKKLNQCRTIMFSRWIQYKITILKTTDEFEESLFSDALIHFWWVLWLSKHSRNTLRIIYDRLTIMIGL